MVSLECENNITRGDWVETKTGGRIMWATGCVTQHPPSHSAFYLTSASLWVRTVFVLMITGCTCDILLLSEWPCSSQRDERDGSLAMGSVLTDTLRRVLCSLSADSPVRVGLLGWQHSQSSRYNLLNTINTRHVIWGQSPVITRAKKKSMPEDSVFTTVSSPMLARLLCHYVTCHDISEHFPVYFQSSGLWSQWREQSTLDTCEREPQCDFIQSCHNNSHGGENTRRCSELNEARYGTLADIGAAGTRKQRNAVMQSTDTELILNIVSL